MTSSISWVTLIVAGGKAERLGGRDKPALEIAGRSLLTTAVSACRSASEIIVLGPERSLPPRSPPVRWARETPEGSGPVAAVDAGLRVLRAASQNAETVVVLAADLPAITDTTVEHLVETLHSGSHDIDGAIATDAEGRRQPLLAAYRRRALRAVVDALPAVAGMSMQRLLGPLNLLEVPLPEAAADIDTPEDLSVWHR